MRVALRTVRIATMALVVASGAMSAGAQPVDDRERAAARELGYSGVADFEAGRFQEALEKLDRAWLAVKLPTVGLWSARALARVGRFVSASERYHQVARAEIPEGPGIERGVQETARTDAARERAELVPKIPALEIVVVGADAKEASLTLDGAPIATALVGTKLPVDPGRHVVEGVIRGQPVREEIALVEAQTHRLEIQAPPIPAVAPPPLRPTAPPPAADRPSPAPGSGVGPWRTAAVISGATGVVAIGIGTAFTFVASSTWDDAQAACPDGGSCPDGRGHELSVDAQDQATVATVFFGIGAAALGAGVVLWLVAPPRSAPAAARAPARVALSF